VLVLGADKTDYNENVVAIKAAEIIRVLLLLQPPPHLFYSPMMRKREFSAPSRHRARFHQQHG